MAAAPHGWDEAAISAAVERQLSDTALLDNNKPLFNGSGWAVTLGSGRDAVELRLRAVAGERAQAASFDGSAATADPMSAGGSPDRRTPQRTFVDTTLGENSTGGATIAVGYSALAGFDTATPYVTATPLGAVSVQAGTSTARGQSAQTRLRTNEEITLPVAGDDPAQARAWRTTAQVTVSVSRRGVADTRVTGGVRVTVSALNALTSLSDVPAVRRDRRRASGGCHPARSWRRRPCPRTCSTTWRWAAGSRSGSANPAARTAPSWPTSSTRTTSGSTARDWSARACPPARSHRGVGRPRRGGNGRSRVPGGASSRSPRPSARRC
ncbi:hypothetical protein ACFQZ4_43125 [Catellatospora coxensis]